MKQILAAFAFLAAVAPAAAQTTPVPLETRVLEYQTGTPIEDYGRQTNLPGVALDAAAPDGDINGPGGLQNGIGAIGTSTPSTSSFNPVPFEDGPGYGIPLDLSGSRN